MGFILVINASNQPYPPFLNTFMSFRKSAMDIPQKCFFVYYFCQKSTHSAKVQSFRKTAFAEYVLFLTELSFPDAKADFAKVP